MAKEKEINIGHDPLAWMAEENIEEEISDESTQNVEMVDESKNQAQSVESRNETQVSDSEEKSSKDVEEIAESTISQDSAIEEVGESRFESETTNVIQASEENNWITINLPNNMTLPYLDDLQAQLHDFLGQSVIFSAENVQRVDTANLQLLLSFVQKNKYVRWNHPSQTLCNAANLLNLSSHLNLPAS